MLALGEGRALWTLLSSGQETTATVHLRTLLEHAARTTRLVAAPHEARRIYDSLGASERDLTEDFALDPKVRETLEQHFAPVVETKTDREILPSMKKLLKAGGLQAIDYGHYRTMSQTAHGTLIAFRNLARTTANVDHDFIAAATRDGSIDFQFVEATYLTLLIINAVANVVLVEITDELVRISNANTVLAGRQTT